MAKSRDANLASFIAALLKTLEDLDPDLKRKVYEHRQRLTLPDLVEALTIVKEIRQGKDGSPPPKAVENEARDFLGMPQIL